jgi:predicted O-linked N-acetylglucosamine transferase (SPINDLY family)
VGKHGRNKKAAPPSRPRPASTQVVGGVMQQARQLHTQGYLAQAETLYRQALRLEPGNAAAIHLLGVIALQHHRTEEAVALISRAVGLNPADAQAHANLGTALMQSNQAEQALKHYDQALSLNPRFAGVHNNRGTVLQLLGRHEEAAQSFAQLLAAAPDADYALGSMFYSRRQCCDWSEFAQHRTGIIAGVHAGRRIDRPFSFLAVSASADEQLQCARNYAAALSAIGGPPLWNGERYAHDRIRIAYVSADFRDHIVGQLMASVYEQHDRAHFEPVGVALNALDDSLTARRTRQALGTLLDVRGMTDADAAREMRRLEIDIAVDLSGYTHGCRPGIFAQRPAPVQVSYLGFPGTMGARFMDYILADDFVIPDSSASHYAEQVVRLPGCFQANDGGPAGVATQATPARGALGLPDATTVFCCFNNSYKLSPDLFAAWMRILEAVPQSVLWLLAEHDASRRNLGAAARAHGIDSGRLIFAARIPYAEHVARLGAADLALDTFPFNGGASTSDALLAGTPVLTCSGDAFAARMAGSLLRAVNLTELITSDLTQYEQLAIGLGRDRVRLQALKTRLAQDGRASDLYDVKRFCRHLENAYREMWRRVQVGHAPRGFAVPAAADGTVAAA